VQAKIKVASRAEEAAHRIKVLRYMCAPHEGTALYVCSRMKVLYVLFLTTCVSYYYEAAARAEEACVCVCVCVCGGGWYCYMCVLYFTTCVSYYYKCTSICVSSALRCVSAAPLLPVLILFAVWRLRHFFFWHRFFFLAPPAGGVSSNKSSDKSIIHIASSHKEII